MPELELDEAEIENENLPVLKSEAIETTVCFGDPRGFSNCFLAGPLGEPKL